MQDKNEQTLNYRLPEYRSRPKGSGTWSAWSAAGNELLSYARVFQNETTSTPGYKLNRYQLPMHPHTRVEWATLVDPTTSTATWTFPDGQTASNEYRGPAGFWGVNADVPLSYYPDETVLAKKALDRLFNDLSVTKGSAAVSMAEIGKTAQMVGDTARRLATAYTSLRHGRMSDFSDALGITVPKRRLEAYRGAYKRQFGSTGDTRQFAASTWLEFSYGWKPLISDVYSQAENLANYLTERQNVVRVARGSAKELKVTKHDPLSLSADWRVRKEVSASMRVGYVVRYRLPDGGNSIVNNFGLNNPALVAWELVPFSFVADWFLPIGNFLEQLTATSGLVFVDGVYTVKYRDEARGSVAEVGIPRANGGGILLSRLTGGGKATHYHVKKTRSVLSSFPSVRLPEFKNPFSVSHALSGIALVQAVFHGGVKGYVKH